MDDRKQKRTSAGSIKRTFGGMLGSLGRSNSLSQSPTNSQVNLNISGPSHVVHVSHKQMPIPIATMPIQERTSSRSPGIAPVRPQRPQVPPTIETSMYTGRLAPTATAALSTSSDYSAPLSPVSAVAKRSSASVRRLSANPNRQSGFAGGFVLPGDYLDKVSTNKPLETVGEEQATRKVPPRPPRSDSVDVALQNLLSRSATVAANTAAPIASSNGPRVFLQVGPFVRRCYLGAGSITMARLREKFGSEFERIPQGQAGKPPVIYIKDPTAGVFYELQEPEDIVESVVLRLGPEYNPNEAMEQLLNAKVMELSHQLSQVRTIVMERTSAPQLNSNSLPTVMRSNSVASIAPNVSNQMRTLQQDVRSLRSELAAVRQTYNNFSYEATDTIQALRAQIAVLQSTHVPKADVTVAPRAAISKGMVHMDHKTEEIANKIEELEGFIQDIKMDVTTRGARPSEVRLNLLKTEIGNVGASLAQLVDSVDRVRPDWKHVWETELQDILREQEFLREQQELLEDLEEDQRALSTVLNQVEQLVHLQKEMKVKREVELDVVSADEAAQELGSVMHEITTIVPDSEKRLRAMEQAEKIRVWEKENKQDEFQQELGSFIGSSKLRKKGGVEEVERKRALARQKVLESLSQQQQQ
jgi:uncharacterized protein YheU (UPF0270 family)